MLSVTRGVRSRPLGDVSSMKVDTVPLLSPTMESELLKDPWVVPYTKTSPIIEEETTGVSAWEEDFQDLSSWCMDTFQGQCDFHIGESTTFEVSGTKYEGNSVSTVEEEGLLKGLKKATDGAKWNLKTNNVKTTEKPSDNHLLLSPTEMANEYAIGYSNEENNAISSCLMSPESTASTSTLSSKQFNSDVSTQSQSKYCVSIDLDYACPTFNPTTNQRDMWDELRTIETTGSDSFDLLSYLWDDEMRSLESSVSTDSSVMLKHRPRTTASPSVFSLAATEVKTEEPTPPTRRKMETRAMSTVTSSSSIETVATSSRRSERTRTTSTNKEEKGIIVRSKTKNKNGKRYYESDSEDEISLSTLLQYKECREKNNEASRRSRRNKKVKESEMAERASDLERDNKLLKMKVEELEKLVTSMRSALLRSALKKEF